MTTSATHPNPLPFTPTNNQPPNLPASTPWLTTREAAGRARCGVKTIYRAARAKQLKASRINGRREFRFLPEWIDQWLMTTVTAPL
jgi:excisionase family DNA binding protein